MSIKEPAIDIFGDFDRSWRVENIDNFFPTAGLKKSIYNSVFIHRAPGSAIQNKILGKQDLNNFVIIEQQNQVLNAKCNQK